MTYHHKEFLKPHRQLERKCKRHDKRQDWPSEEVRIHTHRTRMLLWACASNRHNSIFALQLPEYLSNLEKALAAAGVPSARPRLVVVRGGRAS